MHAHTYAHTHAHTQTRTHTSLPLTPQIVQHVYTYLDQDRRECGGKYGMVTMTTSPDSCVDTAGGVSAPFVEKDGASGRSYTSPV